MGNPAEAATPTKPQKIIVPQDPCDPNPHRSTTHVEIFFHIRTPEILNRQGTVFFRYETKQQRWMASVAVKNPKDSFSRRYGRSKSRRTYFAGLQAATKSPSLHPIVYAGLASSEYPSYEDATKVFEQWINLNLGHIKSEDPRRGLKMDQVRNVG